MIFNGTFITIELQSMLITKYEKFAVSHPVSQKYLLLVPILHSLMIEPYTEFDNFLPL